MTSRQDAKGSLKKREEDVDNVVDRSIKQFRMRARS